MVWGLVLGLLLTFGGETSFIVDYFYGVQVGLNSLFFGDIGCDLLLEKGILWNIWVLNF